MEQEKNIMGLEDLMKIELTEGKSKMKAKLEALHRLVVDYQYYVRYSSKIEDGLVSFNDGTDVYSFLKTLKSYQLDTTTLNNQDIALISEINQKIKAMQESEPRLRRMIRCLEKMKQLQGLPLLEQWNSLTTYEKTSLKVLQEHTKLSSENREYLRTILVEWFIQMKKEKYLNYAREYLDYVKTMHICPQSYDTKEQKIVCFSDGKRMNALRKELAEGQLTRYFEGENQELIIMILAYSKVLSNRKQVFMDYYLQHLLLFIKRLQEKSLFYQDKDFIEQLITLEDNTQKRVMVIELLDKASNTYLNRSHYQRNGKILVKKGENNE